MASPRHSGLGAHPTTGQTDCDTCRPLLEGFTKPLEPIHPSEDLDHEGDGRAASSIRDPLVFYRASIEDKITCLSCAIIRDLALNAASHLLPFPNKEKFHFTQGRGGYRDVRRRMIHASLVVHELDILISRHDDLDALSNYVNCLSPRKINLGFAKQRLLDCFQNHSHRPLGTPTENNEVRIYVIDLRDECLVEATTKLRYVALSYVWGGPDTNAAFTPWECSTNILPAMQRKGFFSKSNKFPATILDAFYFVREMGERYLWIDRYCIPQDDAKHKHNQILSMGAIYKQSIFTVIIADGVLTDGIPGIQDSDNWSIRRSQQPVAHPSGFSLFASIQYHVPTFRSAWATRGWTFQEQLMAQRCIIFRGEQIFFKCDHGVWQEGLPIANTTDWFDESSSRRFPRDDIFTLNYWPDLDTYVTLLDNYKTRSFTYPCDSLQAFSGVLQVLGSDFPGGFFFGLPEVYFSITMLWTRKEGTDALEDRISLAKSKGQAVRSLPSWSWVRWQGDIDFYTNWRFNWDVNPFLVRGSNTLFAFNLVKVTPCATWYKFGGNSHAKQIIKDNWFRYRENPSPFPSRDDMLACWRAKLNVRIGNFTSMGEGPGLQYMVPTANPAEPSAHCIKNESELRLQAVAKRAFLLTDGNILQIHDSKLGEDIIMGYLSVDTPTVGEKGLKEREFIAISYGEYDFTDDNRNPGFISRIKDEELRFAIQRDDRSVYCFYYVLMIEWVAGYAERRGLGRVNKAAWESLEVEEIEIIFS
jgi:hypothetical protein